MDRHDLVDVDECTTVRRRESSVSGVGEGEESSVVLNGHQRPSTRRSDGNGRLNLPRKNIQID